MVHAALSSVNAVKSMAAILATRTAGCRVAEIEPSPGLFTGALKSTRTRSTQTTRE